MHIAALHYRHKRGGLPPANILVANRVLRSILLLDIDGRRPQVIHWIRFGSQTCGAIAFLRRQTVHVIRHSVELLGSHDQIQMWDLFEQRLTTGLRHAAEETKNYVRPILRDPAE